MHQQKGKIVLVYFLLLLLVGSINNIQLNKIKFLEISNIKILGLGTKNNEILLEQIKELELGNIFFLDKKKIKDKIEKNNLVETYDVFKTYPSSLFINIKKTTFLAEINYKEKRFLIGSNKKLLKTSYNNKPIPFIFGNPSITEFLSLKQKIDVSKFEYRNIENLYYFPSKRWDLKFSNGLLIKLPEKNVREILDLVFDLLKKDKFQNFQVIDARIVNQIILNE